MILYPSLGDEPRTSEVDSWQLPTENKGAFHFFSQSTASNWCAFESSPHPMGEDASWPSSALPALGIRQTRAEAVPCNHTRSARRRRINARVCLRVWGRGGASPNFHSRSPSPSSLPPCASTQPLKSPSLSDKTRPSQEPSSPTVREQIVSCTFSGGILQSCRPFLDYEFRIY